MANPFAIAAALAGLVSITCPNCGTKKMVSRHVTPRLCPRCHQELPDPPSTRTKRRKR